MKQTYLEAWKQYLQESVEWMDGDIKISIQEDGSNKEYHNIWLSDTKTRTTYVWMVYADPDSYPKDIRIDITSLTESTKKMKYRYKKPLTFSDTWVTGSNTIKDADWNKVKNNYKATVAGTTITFDRGQWKENGETKKADYIIYLEFKKFLKY